MSPAIRPPPTAPWPIPPRRGKVARLDWSVEMAEPSDQLLQKLMGGELLPSDMFGSGDIEAILDGRDVEPFDAEVLPLSLQRSEQ